MSPKTHTCNDPLIAVGVAKENKNVIFATHHFKTRDSRKQKKDKSAAALTSDRYDADVASPAVHLGAEEPAVLRDGEALDAAERVARTAPAAHAEEDTWWGGGGGGGHKNFHDVSHGYTVINVPAKSWSPGV